MPKAPPSSGRPARTSARLGGLQLQIEPPSSTQIREFETILKRCEIQMQQKVDQIATRMASLEKWKRKSYQVQTTNFQYGQPLNEVRSLKLFSRKNRTDVTHIFQEITPKELSLVHSNSQHQLVTPKENSERIEKAQGELRNLRSEYDTFGRELMARFKDLTEQIRNQYTEHVANSLLAFKNELDVNLDCNVQRAIHLAQDSFRHELDRAVALKNYVTNDGLQNELNHFSQSTQVRIAEVTSMLETQCSKLQGNLDGLATETWDKIANNQKRAEENLRDLEIRASHLETQLKANYEGQLSRWSLDAKNLEEVTRTFQMKLDLSDGAKTAKLQDIKDKFQDALRRISDLEKNSEAEESARTRLQIQDTDENHEVFAFFGTVSKDLQSQQEELYGIENVLNSFEKVESNISTLQTTGHQPAMEELKNARDKLDLVEQTQQDLESSIRNWRVKTTLCGNSEENGSGAILIDSETIELPAPGTSVSLNQMNNMDVDKEYELGMENDNELNNKNSGIAEIPDTRTPISASAAIEKTPEPLHPELPSAIRETTPQNQQQANCSSLTPSHSSPRKNKTPSSMKRRFQIKNLSQKCQQPNLCTAAEKHDSRVLNRAMQSFIYYLAQQKQSKVPPLPHPTEDEMSLLKPLEFIDELLQNDTYALNEYTSLGPNVPRLLSIEEVQRIGWNPDPKYPTIKFSETIDTFPLNPDLPTPFDLLLVSAYVVDVFITACQKNCFIDVYAQQLEPPTVPEAQKLLIHALEHRIATRNREESHPGAVACNQKTDRQFQKRKRLAKRRKETCDSFVELEQFAFLFEDERLCSDDESDVETPRINTRIPLPFRSAKATKLVEHIDRRTIDLYKDSTTRKPGPLPTTREPPSNKSRLLACHERVSLGLPRDCYEEDVLQRLSREQLEGLKAMPDCLVNIDNIQGWHSGSLDSN
ncbi:hypothetical protein VP01_834g2 [Puccinia sorghi]|uniref:Uncharacterized protein n=1 Tax=Puccinia sorghi TaxID=27349 RepID=A0A0L6UBP5_9BASI|nr:hypothetical protein VP01_834g2 [Puccinia sorghi]